MRVLPFALLLACGLMALAAFSPAPAPLGTALQADIPFEFVAGSKTLAAGRYTLERNILPMLVTIRTRDNKVRLTALTRGVEITGQPQEARLVFRQYGHRRFLGEVWSGGQARGRELPPSRLEQLTARYGATEVNVVVAAR